MALSFAHNHPSSMGTRVVSVIFCLAGIVILIGGISLMTQVITMEYLATQNFQTLNDKSSNIQSKWNLDNLELSLISVGIISITVGLFSIITAFGLYLQKYWGIFFGIILSIGGLILSLYGIAVDKNYSIFGTIALSIITVYLIMNLASNRNNNY